MKHLTKFNESKKDSHDDTVQNIVDCFQDCIDDGMTYEILDYTRYNKDGINYQIDFRYKLSKNFNSKNNLTELKNYSNSLLKNKLVIDNMENSILMIISMYSDIKYQIVTYNLEEDEEEVIRVVFYIKN